MNHSQQGDYAQLDKQSNENGRRRTIGVHMKLRILDFRWICSDENYD